MAKKKPLEIVYLGYMKNEDGSFQYPADEYPLETNPPPKLVADIRNAVIKAFSGRIQAG